MTKPTYKFALFSAAVSLFLIFLLAAKVSAQVDPAEPLIKKARDHLNLFQYDQAHALLKQATELAPQNWEPWYLIGRAYIRQKQDLQAEKYLKKAIDLNPGEIDVQKALGALYISMAKTAQNHGRTTEMTDLLHKACRAYPGGTKIWQSLLENWWKMEEFDKIKNEGDFIVRNNARALEQGDDKSLQAALVIVARTYYREGDIAGTEKFIKSATRIRQHNDDLHIIRKEIREKSESALKELVDKANASFNRGSYPEALEYLREAQQIKGTRSSEISEMIEKIEKESVIMSAVQKSDALINAGNFDNALDKLEEVSLQFPEDDRIISKLDFVRTKVDKIKAEEAKKRAAEIMTRKQALDRKKQYDSHLQTGLDHEKSNNFEMAILSFEKALEIAPGQQKLQSKIEDLKQKRDERRAMIDAMAADITELKRLFSANDNEAAHTKAQQMLSRYEENLLDIIVINAEVCLRLGKYDQAKKLIMEFEENEEQKNLYNYLRGMIAYHEGDRDEALNFLKMIREESFRPDIGSTKSMIYLYQYQAGIYIIILILMFPIIRFSREMIIDLKKKRILNKVEKIRATGTYEENLGFLEERFDKGDTSNPKQIAVMLAEALLRTGSHQRAYELAHSVVKKDGRNANAKRIAGEACLQLQDTSPIGLEYIQGLLKIDGSRKPVVNFLAKTYMNSKADHKMAQEFILEAISMNPTDNESIIYLADVYLKREVHTQQALKIFEKAVRIAPEVPDYHAGMISTLRKLDNTPEAAKWLEAARNKFPDEPAFQDTPQAFAGSSSPGSTRPPSGGMPDYESIGEPAPLQFGGGLPDYESIGNEDPSPQDYYDNQPQQAREDPPTPIQGPIKECPHCQAANPAKEYYCTTCGKPLG